MLFDDTKLMKILFFEDQLTAALIHGATIFHEPQKLRLEGFMLTTTDWYPRKCFSQVCVL